MKYARIDGIEKNFSRLIYGTGNDVLRGKDPEKAIACLDAAFEIGFTAFDTAYSYELSEQNIGAWISRRNNREKIVLVDKGCNPGQHGFDDVMTPELIEQQCNESLERLQTSYSDCYNLHRDDDTKEVGPIIDVLNKLKEEGKIRKFGASNWKWYRIKEANEYAESHGLEGFTIASPCFNYAVMNGDPAGASVTISGARNSDARRYYLEHNIPIFSYSSLARGFLSGKYVTSGTVSAKDCLNPVTFEEYYYPENIDRLSHAEDIARRRGCLVSQVCLAWLLQQELNVFPIVGPASAKHIKDNSDALLITLTDEEFAYLDSAQEPHGI